MIYVLGKNDDVKAIFKNNNTNATPYYNMAHNNKIADSDGSKIWAETLEFETIYGSLAAEALDEGIELLIEDDKGVFKLFTIYEIEDTLVNGTHGKKVNAINSCIWDLNHKYLFNKDFHGSSSRRVFDYILENSGWTIDNYNDFYVGGEKSYSVNEGSRQSALDEALKEFDVECQAYILVKNGYVLDRRISLVSKLGEVTGQRFEYRKNLKGVTRKKNNEEMYTKLYVYGGTNSKGVRTSIQSINKVKVLGSKNTYENLPFLLDYTANDKFNGGREFLEGCVVNENIFTPTGLMTWGKKQLNYYNHPKYTYEIDVALLGTRPGIGDTIAVVDHEMDESMNVSARVIETNYSDTNEDDNTIVLGEFNTINVMKPNLIFELQSQVQQATQKLDTQVTWKVELFAPNGTDFEEMDEKKQIIARVFSGLDNVTSSIPLENYQWFFLDSNGKHNSVLEEKYKNVGNVIEITNETAGYTLQCNIKDTKLTDSLFFANEQDLEFFKRIKLGEGDKWKDVNAGVIQYAHYDYENGYIYWSKVTTKESLVSLADQKKAQSFLIIRTGLDCVPIDYMICKWGGHGSNFGFYLKDGVPTIVSQLKDPSTSPTTSWACEYPYQANTTITVNDSSVTKIRKTNGRINLDNRHNIILESSLLSEKAVLKAYWKTEYYSKSENINAIAEITASEFGVVEGQTFQSSCLDYPYLYVTYGFPAEQSFLYCVDMRSKSLIYKIAYDFSHGNINYYYGHAEPETINYYYDANGVKHMLQGFALRNPVEKIGTRQNELYSFVETSRIEVYTSTEYEDEITVEDIQ